MKEQDLMKPRYKVSDEGYPDMIFQPGQIIVLDKVSHDNFVSSFNGQAYWLSPKKAHWYEPFFNRFPSIFKPLQWHQDRDKKDMPTYIKWTNPGTKEVHYFKVEQWISNSLGVYQAHVYDPAAYLFIKDIEPCTETEYLSYLKTKTP